MKPAVRVLVVMSMIGLLLAGCGNGGDDGRDPERSPRDTPMPKPERTVNPGQRGPSASGDYEFTGALELKGEYSVLYPFHDENVDTCAEIADEDVNLYAAPLPSFHGDRRFTWTIAPKDFAGPGTYELDELGPVRLRAQKTQDAEAVVYTAREGASATLVVKKENDGSFEFKDWTNQDGDEVSGRATWTCEEGSEGET